MDPTTIEQLGREIHEAELRAVAIPALTGRFPELGSDAAYNIQEHYVRLREANGARQVGRKIGCTSVAIQELFGIDTPDYGHLFHDMVVEDGGPIELESLVQPMVEPEIAFHLDRDLHGPGLTAEDVLHATRAVAPALEIIDSRIENWHIAFADTVADNGSSARCVLGPEIGYDADHDLARERVELYEEDQALFQGDGRAVLGHPAVAVAWLGNVLWPYGQRLHAGSVILSGSMTRAAPVARGRTYRARFGTLGAVTCRFE